MSIYFTCDKCNKRLRVDPKLAGKRIKCPKCGHIGNAPTKENRATEARSAKNARSDAPCDECGETFVLQTRWPPRGGLCSRCGGHYCYECINVALNKTIKAHPEKAEQFILDDTDMKGLADLAQSKVGDTIMVPTIGKDGAMPCPKCFATSWKRELWQPESFGAYKVDDHNGVIKVAISVQAVIDAHPGDLREKLKIGGDEGKERWKIWRLLNSSTLQLSAADLSGLQLSGANLSNCDLRGAYLNETKSSVLDLCGADLSYADLRGCRWVMTYISNKTVFRYANLTGGSMTVYLQGDWTGANLSNARLKLIGVDKDVCLKDVNLTGCKVTWGGLGDKDTLAKFHELLTPKQQRQLRAASTKQSTDAEETKPTPKAGSPLQGCFMAVCSILFIVAAFSAPIGVIVWLALNEAEAEKERRSQLTGAAKVPVWMEYLKGNDAEKREEAVRELVKLGPEAKSALRELSDAAAFEKRVEVRVAAVTVLGALGPEASGVEGAITLARDHGDPTLRAAAEAALQKIRNPKPAPTPQK